MAIIKITTVINGNNIGAVKSIKNYASGQSHPVVGGEHYAITADGKRLPINTKYVRRGNDLDVSWENEKFTFTDFYSSADAAIEAPQGAVAANVEGAVYNQGLGLIQSGSETAALFVPTQGLGFGYLASGLGLLALGAAGSGGGGTSQAASLFDNNANTQTFAGSTARIYDLGAGADSVISGTGADSLKGGAGNDTILGGGGNDTLLGNEGQDSLVGGTGNDLIDGGDDNDTLNGGGGSDTIIGGSGVDTVDYSTLPSGAISVVLGTGGNGTVTHTIGGIDTLSGVEVVIFTAFNDTLDATGNNDNINLDAADGNDIMTGGNGNDTLMGGAGNDTIFGGAGADSLNGGSGAGDVLTYANSGAVSLVLTGSTGVATQSGVVDTLENFESYILTSNNDTLVGGSGNDVVDAGDGNDLMDGGAGADTLIGGLGNDTINGGSGPDSLDGGAGTGDVATFAGGGAVSLNLSASPVLATTGTDVDTLTGFESYILTGLNDTLTGGAGNDSVDAGDGNDTMDGGAGNDTLMGGEGNDTIHGGTGSDSLNGGNGTGDVATYAGDLAPISLNLSGAPVTATQGGDVDTLVGFESYILTGLNDTVTGGAGNDSVDTGDGNDIMNGGDGDDTFAGGAGEDTLSGGAGADSLSGGDGNDLYIYSSNDTYVEGSGLGSGSDTLDASAQTTGLSITLGANIENLIGGSGNDTLIANNLGNNIDGGDGADSILGGTGVDTLFGNAQSDTLNGGAGSDSLNGGADFDYADYRSSTSTFTFTMGGQMQFNVTDGSDVDTLEQIEGVYLAGGADSIQGSAEGDYINGGDGTNTLYGNAGADTLIGGANSDSINGGADNDSIVGGDGADNIDGGSGDDRLFGDAGDDTINGGLGNDYIESGANGDEVYGGSGNDTVDAGDGNDIVSGGLGADSLNGGFGYDTFLDNDTTTGAGATFTQTASSNATGVGGRATYTRAGETDTLDNFESFNLGGSNDLVTLVGPTGTNINTNGGNDTVNGGTGADTINSGDGNDSVTGGGGNDTIDAGDGDDIVNGGGVDGVTPDSDSISGGLGIDTINYDNTSNLSVHLDLAVTTITSTEYSAGTALSVDTLVGFEVYQLTRYADTLTGGTTNDNVDGGAGNDTMDGGAGIDSLLGGTGSDTLHGGTGNDTINAGVGDTDVVTFAGDASAVTLAIAAALTTVSTSNQGAGNLDSMTNVERYILTSNNDSATGNSLDDYVDGGAGNDTLTGGAGADTLIGGAGKDTLQGGAGADVLIGGQDSLTADSALNSNQALYNNTSSGLTIDLDIVSGVGAVAGANHTQGTTVTRGQGYGASDSNGDEYYDIQDIFANNSTADSVIGSAANNYIFTDAGNDTIYGMEGEDTISAGAGSDTAYGGDGNDVINGDVLQHFRIVSGVVQTYTLGAADLIYGDEGNDLIQGYDGNDTIHGGTGNNTLWGYEGSDLIYGGSGDDKIYGDAQDVSSVSVGYLGANTDYAHAFAGASGYNNTLFDNSSDTITPGSGNDTLEAHDGNDLILFATGDLTRADRWYGDATTYAGDGVHNVDVLQYTGTAALDLSTGFAANLKAVQYFEILDLAGAGNTTVQISDGFLNDQANKQNSTTSSVFVVHGNAGDMLDLDAATGYTVLNSGMFNFEQTSYTIASGSVTLGATISYSVTGAGAFTNTGTHVTGDTYTAYSNTAGNILLVSNTMTVI